MRRLFFFSMVMIVAAWPCAAADDRHVVIITMDGFPAYLYHDPRAPIPTLRKLAADGVEAEAMRVSNPSITWPNHTTLVTGVTPIRHSVLFNGVLTRGNGIDPVRIDPAHDQAELVAVPTLFDVFHAAGLTTAAINWPCTRNSHSIDDNFPDVANQMDFITPSLKAELLSAAILPVSTQSEWAHLSPPQWDRIWTNAACDVIRRRKPNLLVLHMLQTDAIHHAYGPQSLASYVVAALADSQLSDVLLALDDAGIRKQTTVIVTADHGFAIAKKLVEPNVILRKEGLLHAGPAGIVAAQVQVVSEGGSAFVYFNDIATASQLRDRVIKMFEGTEGIADVITPEHYGELDLPLPRANPQVGDLLLTAKEGYAFGAVATGDDVIRDVVVGVSMVGNHGYLSSNPKMNALFVASGRGIRQGHKLGVIDNTSVAPTAAVLLGQTIPGADGRVLTEILGETNR